MATTEEDSYRFRYGKRKAANPFAAASQRASNTAKGGKGKRDKEEEGESGKQFTFSTAKLTEILEMSDQGYTPSRVQNPWFKNQSGVRKSNAVFSFTEDEMMEYAKSKLSVHYFAEKYCKIKREDGSIGEMSLRPYQKGIIDLYTKR